MSTNRIAQPLSLERLKELLRYEPETGTFWCLKSRGVRKMGDEENGHLRLGYLRICIDGKFYSAHRLAFLYMRGRMPAAEIDHINRDRSDNRWQNLREVTRSQNMENKSIYRNKRTSRLMGVSWYAQTQKWKAQIQVAGKKVGLGYFSTESAAYGAYLEAKRIAHPRFSGFGCHTGTHGG